MKELPPDLQRLLDGARGPVPAAPTGARQRVLERVESTLGLPAGAAVAAAPLMASAVVESAAPVSATIAPATSSAVAPAAATSLPLAARWIGAFLLGVGASSAVYLGLHRASNRAPSAVAAPAAAPTTAPFAAPTAVQGAPTIAAPVASPALPPSAALPAPLAAPLPAATTPRPHNRSRAGLASADSEISLAREQALLDIGRAALRSGDAQEALEVTREHQRRYPRGQLVEERECLAIRALATSGQRAEAHSRASTFRRVHPRSIFLPAVDEILK